MSALTVACGLPAGPVGVATPTSPPAAGAATREDMDPVINAAQADPANFAGVWWDASGYWPLHLGYVSDEPETRARIERWIPDGGQVRWHRVAHSYARLDAIQDEIVSWWNSDPDGHGSLRLNSIGVDVVRNRVVVSLVEHDLAFELPLRERHGDAIECILEPPGEPL